ncbi:MAG: putative 2OG-Fe(II) oxygenase [Methylophagaceae bacterium]
MKNLFPIPMLQEQTNLNIEEIHQSILQHRNNKSPDRTNYTSFYDEDGLAGIKHKDAIIEQIKTFTDGYISECIDYDEGFSLDVTADHISAWYNVYSEGIHHCWHDHGRSLLSGTVYIHTDGDSSPFLIKSPLYSIIRGWAGPSEGFSGRFAQQEEFNPKAGDIYIWPGWLEHTVPTQKQTNNPRVSISFNIAAKR